MNKETDEQIGEGKHINQKKKKKGKILNKQILTVSKVNHSEALSEYVYPTNY